MARTPRWLDDRARVAIWILIALTIVTHAAVVSFDFVYDDHWTIVQNAFTADLHNIGHLLDGRAVRQGVPDAERPVMLASIMIDRALFGLAPAGYHFHSLLWHLFNTLLVGLLALRLFGCRRTAWLAAFVFGIWPAHTEAVAVVSYREDLLATAAILSCLLLLLTRRAVPLVPVIAFAGFLAKESTIVLLATWPLLGWLTRPQAGAPPSATSLFRGWLWIAGGIGGGIVARCLWAGDLTLAAAAQIEIPNRGNWLETTGAALRTFWLQLSQLGWPWAHSAVHPDPPPAWPLHLEWLSTGALLVLGVWWWKRFPNRPLRASVMMLGLGFAPLLTPGRLPNLWADRFLYLPLIGFSLILAHLAARICWSARAGRWLLAALAMMALVGHHLVAQSYFDDAALWRRAARVAPNSPRTWIGLTFTSLRRGDIFRAEALVTEGSSNHPNHPGLLGTVAVVRCLRGRDREAWEIFDRAAAVTVVRRERLDLQRAGCALRLHQYERAADWADQSLQRAPWMVDPLLIKGLALMGLEQHGRAKAVLTSAVEMDPDRPACWRALARLHDAMGQVDAARLSREKAIRLQKQEVLFPWSVPNRS